MQLQMVFTFSAVICYTVEGLDTVYKTDPFD